jgi:hypothetical protein
VEGQTVVGAYREYLDRGLNSDFNQLTEERRRQLTRIATLRDRDVLVFAAAIDKPNINNIDYPDILVVKDQLSFLENTKVDVILETPGGVAEVVEDIVKMLHDQFEEVDFIVPGWAKSAGTIMVMAGDEILMEPSSAVGPIDAQMFHNGKFIAADALIEGFEKIKKEVNDTGSLNRAYVPVLQGISPGDLQSAENALNFGKKLVTDWLVRYKFSKWEAHSSTGVPVTQDEREERARSAAHELCNHRKWLTHGRSLKMADLEAMGVKITDYSTDTTLCDAIRRYHTLLRMTFATSGAYKVVETPKAKIVHFAQVMAIGPMLGGGGGPSVPPGVEPGDVAKVNIECGNCHRVHTVQANLKPTLPLDPDAEAWPTGDRLVCNQCGADIDLSQARQQIEAMTGKEVQIP